MTQNIFMAVKQQESDSPLLLRSVTVRHFRCLHDVGPLPVQRGLTVFTGSNDAGKSAMLDAIGLLLRSVNADSNDRSHWVEDDTPIEVEGTFYAVDDIAEDHPVRIRAVSGPEKFRTFEILDVIHAGLGARPSGLPINDLRERMRTLGISSPGGRAKDPYVDAVDDWLSSRPPEEFELRWRPLSAPEAQRLPGSTRFNSTEAPSPLAHVQSLISREARRVLTEDPYAKRLSDISEDVDRDVAPSLDRIKRKIREYCPDLEAVHVDVTFDFARPGLAVSLLVKKAGAFIDLEKGGDGRRRRVVLAIHEANLESLALEAPTSSELLAYDEPDTHLDYAAQRALFEILDRQAALQHVQVLVATHSLNFIDKVPLQSLWHFQLREDLKSDIEILASSAQADEVQFLASVCAGLGLRNSVLLDERCFVVVEGETEEAALPTLFNLTTGRSLTTASVTAINTRGSGSVRRLVEVLVKDWHREVIVLSDEDQRSSLVPWLTRLGLTEDCEYFFIGSKEFEDAFSDAVWLRTLNTHFLLDGTEEWDIEDLRRLREASSFGKDLMQLVRRRCRSNQISKPDIGYALAQTVRGPNELPDVLLRVFTKLSEQ